IGRSSAGRDERRPASALHDRARARDEALDRVGGRADRRARHRNERRDHGPYGPAQPPEPADIRLGHARRGGRRARAADDPHARRSHRLRRQRGLPADGRARVGRGLRDRVESRLSIYFGIPAPTVAAWIAVAVGAVLVGLLLFAIFNRVLLKMALRNIPRRRAQTVLILFGLMLATLIITASLSVGDTLNYSLQAIQLRQIGGIDEAFTRHQANGSVQGASTADSEFFSEAQAADVIARSKTDTNVAAAQGVIVASGSMVDTTTGQSSSENVAIFGVPADFGTVWGQLHSSSGANLSADALASNEVFVGDQLGSTLNAHAGDTLKLYVDGHPTTVTIRGVLDTEVNPSIAGHGPIVNSVLMPLATMRTVMQRPAGYNVILVHNRGTGGCDDLGPSGSIGDEVTQHFRVEFTDPQEAADLIAYLSTPGIKAQVKKIHDQASFRYPTQTFSGQLLTDLNQPAVTDEFKALRRNRFATGVMGNAVV